MNGDDQRDNVSGIIKFYYGEETDGYAYTLRDIWGFSDSELERVHNYIQWLFPTCDPNNKKAGKPFLTQEDIKLFKSDRDLLSNLCYSYDMMITFYGFQHEDDSPVLMKSEDFKAKSKNWISKNNHNYLRLTRIISCLKSMGLDQDAQALFDMLSEIYQEYPGKIGETTFEFWNKAINGTLYDGYSDEKEMVNLKDKLQNINWSL